ncbi:hypothetical protein L599_001900000180 [Luteimonas sp. J16]|jgi:hypothetical protein|nr:hypothetical protein L599_001900000180 [Luteimonas sp. J16]
MALRGCDARDGDTFARTAPDAAEIRDSIDTCKLEAPTRAGCRAQA